MLNIIVIFYYNYLVIFIIVTIIIRYLSLLLLYVYYSYHYGISCFMYSYIIHLLQLLIRRDIFMFSCLILLSISRTSWPSRPIVQILYVACNLQIGRRASIRQNYNNVPFSCYPAHSESMIKCSSPPVDVHVFAI